MVLNTTEGAVVGKNTVHGVVSAVESVLFAMRTCFDPWKRRMPREAVVFDDAPDVILIGVACKS